MTDDDGEAGPARRPRGVVRARLIAEAVELAREGGPDAVVLREATRRVGVAANAAYRHFDDRDELLLAVCIAAMELLAARMAAALAAVPGTGDARQVALERLDAIGDSYLDFAEQEPGLFRTAFAVPDHLDYAAAAVAEGPPTTPFALLGQALDGCVQAGVLPPERRATAQPVVWSVVHGYAVLRQQGPLKQLPREAAAATRDALLAAVRRLL